MVDENGVTTNNFTVGDDSDPGPVKDLLSWKNDSQTAEAATGSANKAIEEVSHWRG